MWAIFRKEFKEGAVLLIVSLAVMILTPWIGQLLAPRFWDRDVTDIFHALMFGLFVPVYLAILAAGMVAGENLALLKALPIAPWTIAAGKLLYLGLNLVVLAAVSLPAILESPKWWESGDLLGVGGWFLLTLSFGTLTFALTTALKKSAYAIFLAGVLLIGLLVKALLSGIYLGPAFLSDPLMIGLTAVAFLIPVPAGMNFFHRLLKSKPLTGRAVALICLYPFTVGLFFLKEPGWQKALILGNVDQWTQISDTEFLVYDDVHDEQGPARYLFDLRTGRMEDFEQLGKTEHISSLTPPGPGWKEIYYYNWAIFKGAGPHDLYQWSRMDLKTGKAEKLGMFPSFTLFFDGRAAWRTGKKDAYGFGFMDLRSGLRYDGPGNTCLRVMIGPAGVLFKIREETEPAWHFADFATGHTRKAFDGNYESRGWNRRACAYLLDGRKLLQWNPVTNTLCEIGEFDLEYEISSSELLLSKSTGSETRILLWKEGKIISAQSFPFASVYPDYWPAQPAAAQIILRFSQSGAPISSLQDGHTIGRLKLHGDALDWKPFPKGTVAARSCFGTDQYLIAVRRTSYSWLGIRKSFLLRAYLYDPATGKMRKLS